MEINNQKLPKHAEVAGISFHLSGEKIDKTHLDWDQFFIYRHKLLTGGVVNQSEHRAAWHSEFRNPNPCGVVQESLGHLRLLSEKVRAQKFSFEIRDVVNIGIGGSDLGPKLVCEAFEDEADGPNVHFVSNLDAVQINLTLKKLRPENTLFIVVSKSFSTLETIENLVKAKQWLLDSGQNPVERIIAVTGNREKAKVQYQISDQYILDMPEWVGGRFSVWSAVGLSIAVAFGFDKFYQLHQGAREMDRHFAETGCVDNMPLQYGLQLNKQIQHCGVRTLGIIPYSYRLRSLAPYLQQLFMESLGKNIQQNGKSVQGCTGPIVYGGVGTNTQHSFQQLMMQGSHPIAADYVLALTQKNSSSVTDMQLITNCLVQVETLRYGACCDSVLKRVKGQHHANLFTINEINFCSLGALMAFYEHVVASIAFLMQINAFDQWGVEINKSKAKEKVHAFNAF